MPSPPRPEVSVFTSRVRYRARKLLRISRTFRVGAYPGPGLHRRSPIVPCGCRKEAEIAQCDSLDQPDILHCRGRIHRFVPVKEGPGFSGCQDGSLNRHYWTLRQNGSLFGICLIEKLLEALPGQGDLRIIGSCRHQRIVGLAGVCALREEAEKKSGDGEKGKKQKISFLGQMDYRCGNP